VRSGAEYTLLSDVVKPGDPLSAIVAYSTYAGRNSIDGAAGDTHGNAAGTQYDLGNDGAFAGLVIGVLHLYTGEGFDFSLPQGALTTKGFTVRRWVTPPEPAVLQRELEACCQLWLISSNVVMLRSEHLDVIQRFFSAGKGVYIWGENDPFYADANLLSRKLVGAEMSGDLPGGQSVGIQARAGEPGLAQHEITTGLKQLFEGNTIATINSIPTLTPLLVGSAKNTVTAIYDTGGRRLILDGGFTRLFCNWDTAGTSRYVVNAAAWLCNFNADW
jgi:hypothetical protein